MTPLTNEKNSIQPKYNTAYSIKLNSNEIKNQFELLIIIKQQFYVKTLYTITF